MIAIGLSRPLSFRTIDRANIDCLSAFHVAGIKPMDEGRHSGNMHFVLGGCEWCRSSWRS